MDAAAEMIEKAIAANPTYAEAYNNLGQFLLTFFPAESLYLDIILKMINSSTQTWGCNNPISRLINGSFKSKRITFSQDMLLVVLLPLPITYPHSSKLSVIGWATGLEKLDNISLN